MRDNREGSGAGVEAGKGGPQSWFKVSGRGCLNHPRPDDFPSVESGALR